MKLQWLGHSAFRLADESGTSIITDPFDPYIGYAMPRLSCDAAVCSHGHSDHHYTAGVDGSPMVIDTVGTHNVRGVRINGVLSNHDPNGGTKRGKNIIYSFDFCGLTVCHMGDIGEACTQALVKKLPPVQILLIPVGGNYTIDAKEAKAYVDAIKPNVVIPMHYQMENKSFAVSTVDPFLALFHTASVTRAETETLEFTASALPASTQIIVAKRCKG